MLWLDVPLLCGATLSLKGNPSAVRFGAASLTATCDSDSRPRVLYVQTSPAAGSLDGKRWLRGDNGAYPRDVPALVALRGVPTSCASADFSTPCASGGAMPWWPAGFHCTWSTVHGSVTRPPVQAHVRWLAEGADAASASPEAYVNCTLPDDESQFAPLAGAAASIVNSTTVVKLSVSYYIQQSEDSTFGSDAREKAAGLKHACITDGWDEDGWKLFGVAGRMRMRVCADARAMLLMRFAETLPFSGEVKGDSISVVYFKYSTCAQWRYEGGYPADDVFTLAAGGVAYENYCDQTTLGGGW